MTSAPAPARGGLPPPARLAALVTVAALVAIGHARAIEPDAPAALALPAAVGLTPVSEAGPRWSSLTPAQREALAPLAGDWAGIDGPRKQKWLEIAARYPSLSKAEQARARERMAEWARLTPSQRGEVRLNFQQASRTTPPAERQAQWQAYQALPAEEKTRLATRAAQANRPAARPSAAATVVAGRTRDGSAPARAADGPARSAAKTNIVPNPLFTTAPRPVGPTVVRSGPGATTTLVTRQPAPPPHQVTGLPKVAATPMLVDQTTLLPQRGPQAAPVVSPGAAAVAAAAGAATAAVAAATPPVVAPGPAAAASAVAASASAPAGSGPPYHDTSVGER